MPGFKNRTIMEKNIFNLGFGDPLGVVLGWSHGCLMVALGWSYVDLGWSQGGHMVVFGWSYGGPRVVLWLS